jgi:hypothetical protein
MCTARPTTAPPSPSQLGYRLGLHGFLPAGIELADLQADLPRIAQDPHLTDQIVAAVRRVPTGHILECGDARHPRSLGPRNVLLVLTSPPYWTLKRYHDQPGQLGHTTDYDVFLDQLDAV